MFWDIFKKKTELPRDFNDEISRGWRERYSLRLLPLLRDTSGLNDIRELYSLLFFLANEKNYNDAIDYIKKGEYKKLSKMNDRVPMDYDESFYEMYDIIYVIGVKNYLAIVKNNENNQDTSFAFITEVAGVDLEMFLGRRLIYPV